MLRSFSEGSLVRDICSDVAICIGEQREDLDRHLAFGVNFIQPTKKCLTSTYIRRLIASGIPSNVFYANERADMLWMIEQGLPGIMTDAPDILINTISAHTEVRRSSKE